MSYLVISASLNPESRSFVLAKEAERLLGAKGKVEFLDLRKLELPLCDGDASFAHENAIHAKKKIQEASCILLAVPIYNYDCNSAAKNLIELTGSAWSEKTVGFLCSAGGRSSYMSIMSLANSLMLDFRCLIIPRFVYADGSAFGDDNSLQDRAVLKRVEELAEAAARLSGINLSVSS